MIKTIEDLQIVSTLRESVDRNCKKETARIERCMVKGTHNKVKRQQIAWTKYLQIIHLIRDQCPESIRNSGIRNPVNKVFCDLFFVL